MAVAAAITVLAIVVGVLSGDPRPAAAEAFQVDVVGETMVIEVVGRVDDAAEAARELEAYGLDVELVGVPASPSLVGEVVATSSESGAHDVDADDGRVSEIRVPRAPSDRLTIRYGREASPGEPYEATESVPGCSAISGRQVTPEVVADLSRRWGPDLRWQQASRAGVAELEREDVAATARVIDVLPLASDAAMVIVSDGESPPPAGMSC